MRQSCAEHQQKAAMEGTRGCCPGRSAAGTGCTPCARCLLMISSAGAAGPRGGPRCARRARPPAPSGTALPAGLGVAAPSRSRPAAQCPCTGWPSRSTAAGPRQTWGRKLSWQAGAAGEGCAPPGWAGTRRQRGACSRVAPDAAHAEAAGVAHSPRVALVGAEHQQQRERERREPACDAGVTCGSCRWARQRALDSAHSSATPALGKT